MAFLFIILMLIATPAYAVQMIGFGEGGGTCASQTPDVSLTTYNTYSLMYDNEERGQSWLAGASGVLYSLTFRRYDTSGTVAPLTIRIGMSTNLATYISEFTCDIETTDVVKECVIPEGSRPTLSSGTTYHALIRLEGGYGYNWPVSRNSTNPYADGNSYFDQTKDWVASPVSSDWYFITTMCD